MTSVTAIQFRSAGVTCRGDLYLPDTAGRAPIMVMAHGLGGTRNMRLPAFAERFVAEGYACLLFDYRHFGDSDGEPRQLLDIKKQLQDWKAAIEHARGLAQVDPDRVILWGTRDFIRGRQSGNHQEGTKKGNQFFSCDHQSLSRELKNLSYCSSMVSLFLSFQQHLQLLQPALGILVMVAVTLTMIMVVAENILTRPELLIRSGTLTRSQHRFARE